MKVYVIHHSRTLFALDYKISSVYANAYSDRNTAISAANQFLRTMQQQYAPTSEMTPIDADDPDHEYSGWLTMNDKIYMAAEILEVKVV